ncbi:MAG: zinc ABC transporter substrate-binding protein [Verrucomicrobiota bacterium]
MITRRQFLRTLPAAAGVLGACEGPEPPPRFILPQRPISVVTTTVQAADLLSEVGGEAVTVKSLIPPMMNPHLWQPTAADLSTVQTADVFVISGLGLEAKFKEDPDTLRKTGLAVAVLSDVLTEADLIHPGEPTEPPDPHFWMNASLWARAAEKAAEVLAEAGPPAANYFKDRAHEYASELQAMHRNMQAKFKEIAPHARFLISSHDSMRYFGQAYGLNVRSLWNARGEDFPAEAYKPITAWLTEHRIRMLFRENITDGELIHARMHDLGLSSNKVIVSVTLGKPGFLMAGLSEGLDAGKYKSAFKYTCDTIYSMLIMVQ